MSSPWEQNLAALQRHHPALAQACRAHAAHLTAVHITGNHAPDILDAIRAAAPRIILQLGIDDGAQARAALQEANAPAQYAIVEPSLQTLCNYLAAAPLDDLIGDARVRWHVGTPNDLVTQWSSWLHTWPWLSMTSATAVFTTARILRDAPEQEDALKQLWLDTVTQVHNDYVYHPADGFAGLANTLANLPRLANMPCITAATGCAAAWPGIVIGAGPSLHAALPALRALQERAILAASPSALPVLLANGIHPHLWMHLERLAEHAALFAALPPDTDHYFVATPHVHPDCWTAQHGTPVWLPCQAGIGQWLTPDTPPPQIGHSSTHAAFAALSTLGCRQIYLVGQDLAYRADQSHTAGAWGDSHAASAAEARIAIPGTNGTTVQSNALWLSFLRRFTHHLIPNFSGNVLHVIAPTEGAWIDGATRMTPEQFAAHVAPIAESPRATLHEHLRCTNAEHNARVATWHQQRARALDMLDATAVWCQRTGLRLQQRQLQRARDLHESPAAWQQFLRDATEAWHPRPALSASHHAAYDQLLLPVLQGLQLQALSTYHQHWAASRTDRAARDAMHTALCQLLSDELFWITQCQLQLRNTHDS